MATWIDTLRPTRPEMLTEAPTEAESTAVGEHFAYPKGLVAEGAVLLVGRTQDAGPETRGLVIFEAVDEEAGRGLMSADPAVLTGVMSATLQPDSIAPAGRIEPTS